MSAPSPEPLLPNLLGATDASSRPPRRSPSQPPLPSPARRPICTSHTARLPCGPRSTAAVRPERPRLPGVTSICGAHQPMSKPFLLGATDGAWPDDQQERHTAAGEPPRHVLELELEHGPVDAGHATEAHVYCTERGGCASSRGPARAGFVPPEPGRAGARGPQRRLDWTDPTPRSRRTF